MRVTVTLVGSEEDTYIEVDVTDEEYAFLRRLAKLSSDAAPKYGPTLALWNPPRDGHGPHEVQCQQGQSGQLEERHVEPAAAAPGAVQDDGDDEADEGKQREHDPSKDRSPAGELPSWPVPNMDLWFVEFDDNGEPKMAHRVVAQHNHDSGLLCRITRCGMHINMLAAPESWWLVPAGELPLAFAGGNCGYRTVDL